ncbi:MAG TPA: hypothetical protein VFL94_06765 [Actinomycetales bacterium]|nr:hypothetical protein [Actinomycetales bacterium]
MAARPRTALVVTFVVVGVLVLATVAVLGIVVVRTLVPGGPDASDVVSADVTAHLSTVPSGTRVELVVAPTAQSRSDQLVLPDSTVDLTYLTPDRTGPSATLGAAERTEVRVDGRRVRHSDGTFGPVDLADGAVTLTFTVPAVHGRRVLFPASLGERVHVRSLTVEADPGTVSSCLLLESHDALAGHDVLAPCDVGQTLRADPARYNGWSDGRVALGYVRLELAPTSGGAAG